MIRFEMSNMPHGGQEIPLKGMRIPFGGQPNKQATVLREIKVPDSIVLHTNAPFKIEEVQKRPRTLRGHIAAAWGITFPGYIDVRMFPKDLWISAPDYFIWSWAQRFFEDHNKKVLRIVPSTRDGASGNNLWVDGKREKEFVILPIKDRKVHFERARLSLQEKEKADRGGDMVKHLLTNAERTTSPV